MFTCSIFLLLFCRKYSELHIYRATLADAGEYACRVSSKLGNDSTKASVIITDTNGKAWLFILLLHSERPCITSLLPSRQKGLKEGKDLLVEVETLKSVRCAKKMNQARLNYCVAEVLGFPYHVKWDVSYESEERALL